MISMHTLNDLVLHSWFVEGIVPEEGPSDGQGITVRLSPGIDS